jgi:WD40 repeat protein
MSSAAVTIQRPSVTVSRSQDTLQPAQRGISRRTVLLRLAGLTVVGIASSSIVLLACSEPPALNSPPAPPTSRPVPTSLSVGTTLYTYRGHSAGVNAVVWSPDGKRIASGSQDLTVQVWDAADGSHVYIYHGHSSFVNAVAWSSDGQRISSGSADKTVRVWVAE